MSDREGRLRSARFPLAFTALATLSLLPLVIVEYPPMVDLPQHAAQIRLWQDLDQHAATHQLNLLTPYLTTYLAGRLLAEALPILTAMKVLVALVILALPFSLLHLLAHTDGERWWALLGFPLSYSFCFYWGLLNFMAAAPLGIVLVTLALDPKRWRGQLRLGREIALAALALALLSTHGLVCAFALLAAGLATLVIAPSLRALALRQLAFVPAAAAGTWWFLATRSAEAQTSKPFSWDFRWSRFAELPGALLGGPGDREAALFGGLILVLVLLVLRRVAAPGPAVDPVTAAGTTAGGATAGGATAGGATAGGATAGGATAGGATAGSATAGGAAAGGAAAGGAAAGGAAAGGAAAGGATAGGAAAGGATAGGATAGGAAAGGAAARLRRARSVPFALALGAFLGAPDIYFRAAFFNLRFAVFLVPWLLLAIVPGRRAGRLHKALVALLAAIWLVNLLPRFLAFDREARELDAPLAAMEPDRRLLGLVFEPFTAAVPAPAHLHLFAWYAARRGGIADFSFAYFYVQLVRYRPGAVEPPVPDAFSWRPRSFDDRLRSSYDYFLVRSAEDRSAQLFPADRPPTARLRLRSGDWWLYERPSPRTSGAAGAGAPSHPESPQR